MKSMTGFGRKNYQSDTLELDVNLRAVNGRFFELRLHLPKELLFLENKFKNIISRTINRGTLDLYVNRRSYHPAHQELKIESKMAKTWVQALKKLGKDVDLDFELSLKDLALLPGVAHTQESFNVPAEEQKTILSVVREAALLCDKERVREGLALKRELLQLLTKLGTIRKKMLKLRDEANEELNLRYREKIKKWTHYDESRLALEISSLIDKADINEEISRLGEHIKGCRDLIGKTEPVGKKLDFYSQEILREINTIGSKSQVSRLTEAVVDAKSVIERFREQVQNIE